MLTRDTFTAPFAHHIFYSKLILKASIFPALGFSFLLKCEKYLLVMSQSQDPSGFAKCAPHMPEIPLPYRKSLSHVNAKFSPKHRFTTRKWGKDAFGPEKDQPSQKTTPTSSCWHKEPPQSRWKLLHQDLLEMC